MKSEPTKNPTYDEWLGEPDRGSDYESPPGGFKFDEVWILDQAREYITNTYRQHYSGNDGSGTQTMDLVIDSGHGVGFNVGNIIKYAQRHRKKGGVVEWRKDLFKIIHHSIILIHMLDEEFDLKYQKDPKVQSDPACSCTECKCKG